MGEWMREGRCWHPGGVGATEWHATAAQAGLLASSSRARAQKPRLQKRRPSAGSRWPALVRRGAAPTCHVGGPRHGQPVQQRQDACVQQPAAPLGAARGQRAQHLRAVGFRGRRGRLLGQARILVEAGSSAAACQVEAGSAAAACKFATATATAPDAHEPRRQAQPRAPVSQPPDVPSGLSRRRCLPGPCRWPPPPVQGTFSQGGSCARARGTARQGGGGGCKRALPPRGAADPAAAAARWGCCAAVKHGPKCQAWVLRACAAVHSAVALATVQLCHARKQCHTNPTDLGVHSHRLGPHELLGISRRLLHLACMAQVHWEHNEKGGR